MNTCEIAFMWLPQNTFDYESKLFLSDGLVLSSIAWANVDPNLQI